jgi:hypothetical protein
MEGCLMLSSCDNVLIKTVSGESIPEPDPVFVPRENPGVWQKIKYIKKGSRSLPLINNTI